MKKVPVTQLGDEYRAMVLAAIEKQRGSHVGAVLTCEYTNSINDYEFFMWTGSHPAGKGLHKLRCSVTTQERLDTHWAGFVENAASKQRHTPDM